MADEVSENIENALNKIVNTTDQSGNMRKELKKTIFETVSNLRNLFRKMKGILDEKTRQNKRMEKEIRELMHAEMQPLWDMQRHLASESGTHQKPSVDRFCHHTTIIGSFILG
jgi:methylphosphotriester-DNA--protein-cysteine methyltransferase